MQETVLQIDPYLFEKHYQAFTAFVEEQSNVPFLSFASHPYTDKAEGYKYEIYRTARDNLAFQSWELSDIGSGKIISFAIDSIEIKNNNLVSWQSRYGNEKRPHQALHIADSKPNTVRYIEQCIFDLYHDNNESKSFSELIDIFGKKYALIAYLFFIKDSSKYLPIAPSYFDNTFKLLGVDFKTGKQCSWGNYSQYIHLINKLKTMLSEELSSDVTLLDAHSFAWILSAQMKKNNKVADVKEYLNLSRTERESIVKSRIGQGQFRDSLINYWGSCAVTGCQVINLLKASHIKPWAKSEVTDRLSLYNGILLSPTLDACFDAGYISFDNTGNIMISDGLSENDIKALNIQKDMKLSKIENMHKKYLKYHRENIFKQS